VRKQISLLEAQQDQQVRSGSMVYSMYGVVAQYLLAGIILLVSVRSAKGVRHESVARAHHPR
jgi:hypothetical protein